ncbi:MAG: hypothetical protein L3J58_01015 [Emcibacter sp.]|nr:hypothetical protein [Emcibacter sp.]
MLKGTTIKTIAIASFMMTGGYTAVQAYEPGSTNVSQSVQAINIDKKISKSDAKTIMKDYLKSKKAYKKLSVGDIIKQRDGWKVRITNNQKLTVATTYVNSKTGEITFKR